MQEPRVETRVLSGTDESCCHEPPRRQTQAELRAQFGPPSSAQDSVWYYDTSKGTLRIHFNNGVVSHAPPGGFELTTLTRPKK